MKKRIAIPLENGILCSHFGHCQQFAIIDAENKSISKEILVTPPPHEPGLLPPWLAKQGAKMIIAGGMGQRAQQLFAQQGIQVVVGAPAETPEKLITEYFAGTLQVGENVCDH